VYNRDTRELSGTVVFFDNKVFLGKNNFVVPAKSVRDVSIDWTVTTGDHVIFAKIENAKFLIAKDNYEEVYVAENQTEESKRSVSAKVDLKNPIQNSETVSSVKKIVAENTPAFVTKTINSTIDVLEGIRESGSIYSDEKKDTVKKDIATIDETEVSNTSLTEKDIDKAVEKNTTEILLDKAKTGKNTKEITNKIQKPFKYLQLFFLTIFSFVFNNKIVFYLLLVVIIFFLLRFLWRLIF
jgi:hypothetical protein